MALLIVNSVVICTRNRAAEVSQALRYLLPQAADFVDVEVIVVDNGSTDDTKAQVASVAAEIGFSVNYVFEPIAGLCKARNRGRAEAKGSVLIYIDDDVIVGEGWLGRIREHFAEGRNDCLGGKVTAELEGDLPFPMDDSMLWFFQATAFGEERRDLVFPEHPIGCNMAFTTKVFDAVGGFDTNLKLYGDETDFFRRVSENGFRALYDPATVVDQVIPPARLTAKEIAEKSFKWGQGSAEIWRSQNSDVARRLMTIGKYALGAGYLRVRQILTPTFGRYFTYWYNRGYLSTLLRGGIGEEKG